VEHPYDLRHGGGAFALNVGVPPFLLVVAGVGFEPT
jgi:hypothetical protein